MSKFINLKNNKKKKKTRKAYELIDVTLAKELII